MGLRRPFKYPDTPREFLANSKHDTKVANVLAIGSISLAIVSLALAWIRF